MWGRRDVGLDVRFSGGGRIASTGRTFSVEVVPGSSFLSVADSRRRKEEQMGTRADFYVGDLDHPAEMKYLGSIAWDGYPSALPEICAAKDILTFSQAVTARLLKDDGSEANTNGWPWPWKDSRTTDYAYCFDVEKNVVAASSFGSPWFDPLDESQLDEACHNLVEKIDFPDMTAMQKVTIGPRSGVMVFGVKDGKVSLLGDEKGST